VKKFLSVILLTAVLMGIFCFTSRADGVQSAAEAIIEAIPTRAAEVDLSPYGLTDNDISSILSTVYKKDPLCFLLKSVTYTLNPTTNKVLKVRPTYSLEADEHKAAVALVEAKTSQYVNSIPSSITSDADKLLFIHDLLIKNTKYDTTYESNNVYSLYKTNTATCQAYAMAFLNICRKLGIEAEIVTSVEMSHMWNRVKLDGKWYNVDVTHDDPTSDRLLRASHSHFLCSDAKLNAMGYKGYETGLCSSTEYDNAFWNETTNVLGYYDGKWYYVNASNGGVYAGTIKGTKKLFDIEKAWTSGSNSFYPGCYSGIGIISDRLIYNTADHIISYDFSSNTHTAILSPQLSNYNHVYALSCNGNTVEYVVAKDPNGKNDTLKTFNYDPDVFVAPTSSTAPQTSTAIPPASTVAPPTSTLTPPSTSAYYKISFTSEGKVISQLSVKKGDVIKAPNEEPRKSSDFNGSYEFIGWKGFTEGMTASSDISFAAVFEFVPYPTIPSTARPTTARPTYTNRPTSTVGNTTTPPGITATPSQSPPESTVPYSSFVPSSPDSAVTVPPASTTVAATTSAKDPSSPNYTGSDQASPSHNIPQKTTGFIDDEYIPGLSSSEPDHSRNNVPEEKKNEATPWIIAGLGSALVVGAIIIKETVISPRLAKSKAAVEPKKTKEDE